MFTCANANVWEGSVVVGVNRGIVGPGFVSIPLNINNNSTSMKVPSLVRYLLESVRCLCVVVTNVCRVCLPAARGT